MLANVVANAARGGQHQCKHGVGDDQGG
jgi:hypothetical protein